MAVPPSPSGPSATPVDPSAALPGEAATAEALRQEAFDVAHRLMKDFPETNDGLALLGNVYWDFWNSTEAEKCWLQCIERDPTRASTYRGLAAIALKKDENQKAIELSRKAMTLAPNLPEMRRGYAEALLAAGEPSEAAVVLQQQVELNLDCSEDRYLLGQAYYQCGELEKAKGQYEKALEMAPDDSRPCHGLARISARLGKQDLAKQYMEKFQKLLAAENKIKDQRGERDVDALYWATLVLVKTYSSAAPVYLARRDSKTAERYWRRTASLDPKDETSRQRLVELYRQSRRPQEALQFCQQLREIDPNLAVYQLNTGVLLAQVDRFDEAEKAFEQSIALAPQEPTGYRSLITLLLARNHRLPDAKNLAQKLVELQPTSFNYFKLSDVCYRNGDLPGALAAMKRAHELEPGSQTIERAYKWLQERKPK